MDTYGTEYKDLVKETADRIDNISQSRINVRKDDIQDVYEDSVMRQKRLPKRLYTTMLLNHLQNSTAIILSEWMFQLLLSHIYSQQ